MANLEITFDLNEYAHHPALNVLYDEYGECYMWAEIEARAVEDHYGVPGSPRWTTMEDMSVIAYEVNGEYMTFKEFERRYGKDVMDILDEFICERADEQDIEDWS